MITQQPAGGWLNTKTAGEYSGLSSRTIRAAAEDGRISGCKWGRNWLFRPEDIDEAIETGRIRISASPMKKTA